MAWKHRTVKQEWEVVGLYKDFSMRQIAEATGLSTWTVRDILLKYHIPLRGRSYHSAQFRYAYDKYLWHKILYFLYWEREFSLERTAATVKLDTGTVRRRMHTLGIRIRSTAESNKGQRRRKYNYRPDKPECVTKNCTTKVLIEGEVHCANCRRRPGRRAKLEGLKA